MAQLIYEKEITGLVVIDPYNAFISEGGKVCSGYGVVGAVHSLVMGDETPKLQPHALSPI